MSTPLLLVLGFFFVAPVAFAQSSGGCTPAVGPVVLGGSADPAVSARMQILFDEDQAARMEEAVDWAVLGPQDAARRTEVMGYLEDGKLTTRADFYYAAFLFQHGDLPEHYKLANRLAARAVVLGHDARWIYAATLDRYLLSVGERQRFGTQYTSYDGCTYILEPTDPEVSDAYRALYGVPSLAAAEEGAAGFSGKDCLNTED